MSYSGGVFSINTTGQPVVAGTTISASVFNALTADLATGLSTCMLKDGTQTATAGIGFFAGTVSLPGIYFGTDTATGLYRIGLNNTGYSINGTKLLDLAAGAVGVTGTLSLSGLLTSTVSSGNFLISNTATTGNAFGRISNTTGNFYWGVESSAGGSIISGAPAYASVISGGSLFISASSGGAFHFAITSSGSFSYGGINPSAAGTASANIFSSSAGGSTTTLYIGNASINVTSDVRLKTNVRNTERDAVSLIKQLRVVDHGWDDPSDQCENNRNSRGEWMGVIAQEAVEVVPWLVNKPTTDVNEDGSKNYWNMDLAYGFALTAKAIQQLNDRLEKAGI